jgi:hypothetical protein
MLGVDEDELITFGSDGDHAVGDVSRDPGQRGGCRQP